MQNVFTTPKQIEQALRHLSIVADMAAENANEGIVVADLNGNLLFVNQAWCEMHGYTSKDELIGKQLNLFHTKEQMKTDMIPLLEKTRRCGQTKDAIEHIKRNGTTFITRTKIISVEDGAGKITGFIIFAAKIGQSPKIKDTTVNNLKRIKHLSKRISQLRTLFGECREIGESLAEETCELQANNETLLQKMGELDNSLLLPEQYFQQIRPLKDQKEIKNQLPEETNPEQQIKEAPTKRSETIVKSKKSIQPTETKEHEEVAELARRLSELSSQNILSIHKDAAVEFELCQINTK